MEAFQSGLTAAGDGGALAARLFSARSRAVGGGASAGSTGSYLSGLLIGAEVASIPAFFGEGHVTVELIGETTLCRLYGQALESRGLSFAIFDGEACAVAGLFGLWRGK
jgi:2-dehydro-3-deoxygalactonokinase